MVKGRQLPEAFIEKLRRFIPANQWDKVLKTFSIERPTTFRVNSLKTSSSSLKERLEPQGFKIENVPWYKEAFLLRKGKQKDLEKTDLYLKGEIYVQGLSSMIPPLVLAPQPGDIVLDLTAAPGSKTTQLSTLMKNQGRILANDNNPIRLEKLKANAQNQGATNVETLPADDGGLVWKNNFEKFDKVLLDAPCSSEGRFLLDAPSTYGYWKEDTNRKMAKDQRRLFKSAFLSLKSGGTMVYSTCTFAPEENEMVLQWALETYGDALQMEEIAQALPSHTRGLAAWGDLKFNPVVVKSIRVLPTPDIEGFFVARLRKSRSVEAPEPFIPA
ncbi:MAG TPA: RsmB/NOP family class I SAM-dependent RNA methyltransferase [bacterium]|jgi:NOL1/NOP2/sun family putative RNA methylase|nr:RsmB/NOP family class I SAM-dependent RNA methyltransferase [bacterium]